MPTRRTQIVLLVLVAAMTFASGLLIILEPAPIAPQINISIPLQSVEQDRSPVKTLFNTVPKVTSDRWKAIVIHDSGASAGSLATVNRAHEKLGLGGLGYHFVINNGLGGDDGEIEVGFRWQGQRDGAYGVSQDGSWSNDQAIGICLIGDMDSGAPTAAQLDRLVWLVRQLQMKFDIPSNEVFVQTGRTSHPQPGRLFPVASFSTQLLTSAH